jgi:hypothetical protein
MWVKLSDTFPEDERILGLSDKAFRLHVAALCASARNLTDGVISLERFRALSALVGAGKPELEELTSCGLWEGEGPWTIRKYLDYNWSAEKVRDERRKAAERKAKSRAESRRDSQEDSRRESRRESRVESHDIVPSRPVPVPKPVEDPPSSRSVAREAEPNGGQGGGDIDFDQVLKSVDEVIA